MKSVQVGASGPIHGRITPPGDKSISHRAAFFGALSSAGIEVSNFSPGADCASTLECLRQLGCEVSRKNDRVSVRKGSLGSESAGILDAGNSGTTARLLCGLLAGIPGVFSVITGDDSLRKRPMKRIVAPLRTLGARIDGREGGAFLPLSVRGTRLCGGSFTLEVASAQVKTALILAGLNAQESVTVVEPLRTRDHTEIMLNHLGVPLRNEGGAITVYPCSDLPGGSWRIPGDFSSAAFWIVAASIVEGSRLLLEGIGANPTRTGLLGHLERMGAKLKWGPLSLSGGESQADLEVTASSLEPVTIGEKDVPAMVDELPVLAVAATQARGISRIRGARELRFKETDRIRAMTEGLKRLGARIEELEDGWIIEGPSKLHGGTVDGCGDHRIAMALSIAALVADGPVTVNDSGCVDISYPSFFEDLEAVLSCRVGS
jgi:3-phosphoshikimate 1-carboxyvinyltransferase